MAPKEKTTDNNEAHEKEARAQIEIGVLRRKEADTLEPSKYGESSYDVGVYE